MLSKPPQIFVIEDDDVDFRLLVHAFHTQKLINPVVRAKDGEDAIDMLSNIAKNGPFIILLDLNMPRMNGHEFLHELRKHPKYAKTVVFVLTTSADRDDIEESFDHHVAGYFLKDDAGESINQVVDVINGYWQIVLLPEVK
ncbi:response regulator [Agaribacter marinus]|uniref:Response regulator n=1 Tax=Agaribacter marinus TaxID=1431249 RepID=A0AA37T1N8_9ALTE|nr:response regulator [Agaribacter marinus]GLR70105.1 response regulator [Agaribacter marinus]